MRMSLQTKPLVVKEISSLSLGYASALEEIPLPTLGLVCKDTIPSKEILEKYHV